jgi:hypothetical protein
VRRGISASFRWTSQFRILDRLTRVSGEAGFRGGCVRRVFRQQPLGATEYLTRPLPNPCRRRQDRMAIGRQAHDIRLVRNIVAHVAKYIDHNQIASHYREATTALFIVVFGGISTIEGPMQSSAPYTLGEIVPNCGRVCLILADRAAISVISLKHRGLLGADGLHQHALKRLSGTGERTSR